MMGVHHPVSCRWSTSIFVTEEIPAIKSTPTTACPCMRCPISDYYCRQEKNGLLVGFYEQDVQVPGGMDGIDPNDLSNASLP